MERRWRLVTAALLWAAAIPAPGGDRTDPVGTVNAFRQALEGGNERAAMSHLAPELLVFESGEQNQSRSDYAAHHMKADMAFLANASVTVLDQMASAHGAVAWVTTRSRIATQDRDVISTETMVLRRKKAGWRIVHIHWSSRAASAEHD